MDETELLQRYADHFRELGYEVGESEGLTARHEAYPAVKLVPKGPGLLVIGWFGVKPGADALTFSNQMNQVSLAMHFLVDDEGDLTLEGWVPGPYVREVATAFIEMWHRDWQVMLAHEGTDAVVA